MYLRESQLRVSVSRGHPLHPHGISSWSHALHLGTPTPCDVSPSARLHRILREVDQNRRLGVSCLRWDALTCGACMLWMISGGSTGEQRGSGTAGSPSQAA